MIDHVGFFSRAMFEDFDPDEDTYVISISTPGDSLPSNLEGWAKLLSLQFHDANPTGCSAEWRQSKIFFNNDYAKLVYDFFLEAYSLQRRVTLIVHCDAGISRSAAIAKFISEQAGLPFDERYRAYNRYVYQLLCLCHLRETHQEHQ